MNDLVENEVEFLMGLVREKLERMETQVQIVRSLERKLAQASPFDKIPPTPFVKGGVGGRGLAINATAPAGREPKRRGRPVGRRPISPSPGQGEGRDGGRNATRKRRELDEANISPEDRAWLEDDN